MGDGEHFHRAIKVKMLMFGPLAEKMGTREINLSLAEGTSIRDLAKKVCRVLPRIEHLLNT